jgi:hypothetical protein
MLGDIWGFNSAELDWGTVATSAATTAAFGIGTGVLAGAAVAAGVISAPVLLIAGAAILVGMGVNAYLKRADEALQAGQTDFTGRAALAAAGDAVGFSSAYEGFTGRDAVTGRKFGSQERSEKLGTGIGSVATLFAGKRPYNFGTSLGKKAIAAGYINPYTIPSASRPSFYNPIIFGKYETPAGLPLEGNIFSGVRSGAGTFLRTGSASDAYAATVQQSRGNLFHILRHFSDDPARVNLKGNPQSHGVFLPEYRGRVVQLLDNSFELATNPTQQVAYVEGQGARVAVTVFSEGKAFGTQLGNPAAPPKPGQYPYGAAVDVYTTIFSGNAPYTPVTMYPGFPAK